MKANTTKQYPYTGDLYGYTQVTSADGSVTENVYDEVPSQVTMSLTVDYFGFLVIESQFKMQLDAYIGNIRDTNDQEIYLNGLWKVIQTAPLLGPMGIKAGYKYKASMIQGEI